IPGYSYYDPSDVLAGLEQSAYGAVAFSVGQFITQYYLDNRVKSRFPSADGGAFTVLPRRSKQNTIRDEIHSYRRHTWQPPVVDKRHIAAGSVESKLIYTYIGIGAFCYFLNISGISKLPTLTSIVGGGFNLLIAGLMLKIWLAWSSGNRR